MRCPGLISDDYLSSFHDIDQILHCREALFSLMSHKDHLRSSLKLSLECTNLLQAKVIKESLSIARDHQIPQASLRYAISLSKLAQVCDDLGVNIDGSAKFDLANVLWDQGEMTTSIQMLQQVNDQNDLHKQAIPVSRALLLSSLVSIRPQVRECARYLMCYRVITSPRLA